MIETPQQQKIEQVIVKQQEQQPKQKPVKQLRSVDEPKQEQVAAVVLEQNKNSVEKPVLIQHQAQQQPIV